MSQMSGRRGLTIAVVGVTAGAGLVLLGASRAWWRETVPRPAPLRPEEIVHTGASLAPVLPALGLVAVAGAGGLLATRGTARRLVGGLLAVVGVAMVAVVLGLLGDPVGFGWPLACITGAVVAGGAGALAARHGHRWPVMGSRYARSTPAVEPIRATASTASTAGRDAVSAAGRGAASGAGRGAARGAGRGAASGAGRGAASAAGGVGATGDLGGAGDLARDGDLGRAGGLGEAGESSAASAASRPEGGHPDGGRPDGEPTRDTTELWDALDRGEDPTRS